MDLFPQPLTREAFMSKGLTIMPVIGQGMEPALRSDWDFVMVKPVKTFLYDSIYVVESLGFPCLYRCQSVGGGKIGLMNDNPLFGATPAERMREVPYEDFVEHVLGIVVCDLKVRDAKLIREAWLGAAA